MPDSLPPKGIKYTDLTLSSGEGLGPNSHGVQRATIKDSDVKGFFKPVSVENHYPPELAKWSVAISQIYRAFMGNDAAEERLVYDERNNIVGTLSVAAPNAKPLLFASEKTTSDPILNRFINPSPETLIQLNIAQLLATSWFMKEDDLHGAQILFCHDGTDEQGIYINPRYVRIDFDMSFYPKIRVWKGERWVDGVWRELAEKNMRFTPGAVTDFPNFHDGPYYWPSKPGVMGYKECKSMTSFQQLPHDLKFKLQKFEAILRQLLLFQPQVIRLRLQEHFSEKTDKAFIDEVMEYLQKLYDEFYLANVFYRGDEKTKDPAFKDFLRRRPSAVKKVLEHAQKINEEFEVKKLPGAFNITDLHLKYHQIWRDSFWPQFNDIRLRAYKLYENLANLVSVSPISALDAESPLSPSGEKTEVSSAQELFPVLSLERFADIEIACDEDSPLKAAYEKCRKAIPPLIRDIESYFKVPTSKLTPEYNAEMVSKLSEAEKVLIPLLKDVGQATSSDDNLRTLLLLLNEMKSSVDLNENIRKRDLGKDKPIDAVDNDAHPEAAFLPYNDLHVVQDVIKLMFTWVNNNKEQFHQLVDEAIKRYGDTKSRAEPIQNYLKLSGEEGKNQLAYIFSRGGWEYGSTLYSTSLNMHLFNLLLRKINHSNLQPTLDGLKDKYFYDEVYEIAIKKYSTSSHELFHPYHDTMLPLFTESLFNWVKEQWELKQSIALGDTTNSESSLLFEEKLKSAIALYNKNRAVGASLWHDSSSNITKLLRDGFSYPYIFSEVLLTSGTGDQSLATNLFKLIFPEVIKSNPKLSILKFSLHGQELLEQLGSKASEVKRECEENPNIGALRIIPTATRSSGVKGWFGF